MANSLMPQGPGDSAGAGSNGASGVNGTPSIAGASSPSPELSINRAPPTRGQPPASPFQSVHDDMKQAKAAYKQATDLQEGLDRVREEMNDLMDMGDVVRPEDVINAAGRLIGKGFDSHELATLLATMPTVGGEGLASWVRMNEIKVTAAEANIARQNDLIRHRMTVSAIRSLAADHTEQKLKERSAIQSHIAGSLGPGVSAGPSPNPIAPVSVMQMQQPSPGVEGQETEM
jgi:hypothetical protein